MKRNEHNETPAGSEHSHGGGGGYSGYFWLGVCRWDFHTTTTTTVYSVFPYVYMALPT